MSFHDCGGSSLAKRRLYMVLNFVFRPEQISLERVDMSSEAREV